MRLPWTKLALDKSLSGVLLVLTLPIDLLIALAIIVDGARSRTTEARSFIARPA